MKPLFIFLVFSRYSYCYAEGALPIADKVLVKKAERKEHLLKGNVSYREYKIALVGEPIGHQQQSGDHRTPEGLYT